jgi:quercetin dioxygenase-like cupin family protein
MDEQEILAKISLFGKKRENAIKRCHKTVTSWGLKLPDVTPDPLHFGFNDFINTGIIEFNINNNVEHGYCGKFIFMFKGQMCPMHHHKKKHETFFLVKGKVDMQLAGKKIVMNQGDTLVVKQNARHEFAALELEDSLILESSMPDLVDDSIFDDQSINKKIFGKETF